MSTVNITQVLGPLLVSAILKGKDIEPLIDTLVESQINQTVLQQILTQLNVPDEWRPLVDTLMQLFQLDELRALMAAIRNEEYKPVISIDKVIELVVMLNMITALGQAVGGGTQQGGSTGG